MIPILVESFRILHSQKWIPNKLSTRNFYRSRLFPLALDYTRLSRPKPNREPVRRLPRRTMQNMSFPSQPWENNGTEVIHQDHWLFHLYLSQCHLLLNLHSLQKLVHRNRETTRRPISRTPSWHRERRHIDASNYKPLANTLISPIILSNIWYSLRPFPKSRKHRKSQNSRTKI